MTHLQRLISNEIQTIQGQRVYCIDALASEGLEAWEAREFEALVKQYDLQLIELNNRQSIVK